MKQKFCIHISFMLSYCRYRCSLADAGRRKPSPGIDMKISHNIQIRPPGARKGYAESPTRECRVSDKVHPRHRHP